MAPQVSVRLCMCGNGRVAFLNEYICEYLLPSCGRMPAFQTVVPLVLLEQIQGSLNVWSSSVCNCRMTLFGEASLKDGIISSEVTPETQTRGEIAHTSFVCV